MTQTKHTSGPWYLAADYQQGQTAHDIATIYGVTSQPTEDGKGQQWLHISVKKPCYEVSQEEQEANARLMSAAPQLLEALERIVESLPSGSQPWEANSQEMTAREIARSHCGCQWTGGMTTAEFTVLAKRIAGARWKTSLGPMIGKCRTQVWEYASGKRAVPESVAKLMSLLAKEAVERSQETK